MTSRLLAALIPAQSLDQANAGLSRSGLPFDLTQLKPEQLEALVDGDSIPDEPVGNDLSKQRLVPKAARLGSRLAPGGILRIVNKSE